jgi:tRNA threonylcarbamoyladenosine biosynthesis protein TsaB
MPSSAPDTEKIPIVLALETTGKCGSIALVSPDHTIAEYSLVTETTHSRRLLSGIEWIMKDGGLSWQNIDAVAVSLGPGSFTGLRIGLSAAKGLVMAANNKMIGVPTLDALACQLPFSVHQICPVIDARKKEVYTAFFRYSPEYKNIERISDYRAIEPHALAAEIKEPTIFLGDGATVYGELFQQELGDLAMLAPAAMFFARAACVGKIGLEMLKNQEAIDPATATPIYIRKSDAELHLSTPKKK